MNLLITGVSSGLGHGLAQVYLDQGATVYGISRRVPEDLTARGLIHLSLDLNGDPNAPNRFKNWLIGMNSFACVFLNAGKLGEIRDMKDTPMEDLRETMEINVWSNKWILDALFSEDRTVKQVVAISSGASITGHRGWNGYSISKAALNVLIKLYAGERTETHFCSLAPGLIDSAMQDYLTSLPPDDRYQPLEILRKAKGTEKMPDGETCARMIVEALPKLREKESGGYADIRKL